MVHGEAVEVHFFALPCFWQGDGNLLAAAVGGGAQSAFAGLGAVGVEVHFVIAAASLVRGVGGEGDDDGTPLTSLASSVPPLRGG